MSRFRWIAPGLAALLTAAALHAAGAGFVQVDELKSSDTRAGDQFGAAVAVGDGVIAVGAYLADANGKDSGAVYLFKKATGGSWVSFGNGGRIARAAGEYFGFDVAIQGNRLVVGAPHPGSGTGAAYVYTFDATTGTVNPQPLVLTVPGARNGDEVGSAVAIDGDRVAVGARGTNGRSGGVYLFSTAGGPPMTLPVTPPPGVELGQSVALRGKKLVAGAPLSGRDGSPGTVYVFGENGTVWSQLEPLRPPSGSSPGSAFGYSVAIDSLSGVVVVGAPLASFRGKEGGAVYTFPGRRNDGETGAQLGVAVAADSGTIVVGARGADERQGAAYVYTGDVLGAPSYPNQRHKGAEFGFSAAIRNQTIVVGAFKEGAAYVFEPPPVDPHDWKVTMDLAESIEVTEGAGFVTVDVSVTVTGSALPEDLKVNISPSSAASDQAAAGSDYNPTVKSLTFSKSLGTKTKPVQIPIVDDDDPEPEETFTVTLTAANVASVTPASASIKIKDDDCVVLSLPDDSLSLVENGSAARFDVSLPRQPAADVTLKFKFDSDPEDPPGDRPDVKVTLQPEEWLYAVDHWHRSRTVSLKAEDDELCNDTSRSFKLEVTAESADPLFACIQQTISGTVESDDDPCLAAAASASVCSDSEDSVLIEVLIENTGGVRLENRPGPDLLFPLPDALTVVTASADRGAATVDYIQNEVGWSGGIPSDAEAIIRIVASLEAGVEPGDKVELSGTYSYDGGTAEFTTDFTVSEVEPCPPPPPE